MEYDELLQSALDYIDGRITEDIRAGELAHAAGYSVYHFCRLFASLTGTPIMAYVTRRKLEYALYDLSQGGRIIDVAMDTDLKLTRVSLKRSRNTLAVRRRCTGCTSLPISPYGRRSTAFNLKTEESQCRSKSKKCSLFSSPERRAAILCRT